MMEFSYDSKVESNFVASQNISTCFRYAMTMNLLRCRSLPSQGPRAIHTRVMSLSEDWEASVWSWPSGWWNVERSTLS